MEEGWTRLLREQCLAGREEVEEAWQAGRPLYCDVCGICGLRQSGWFIDKMLDGGA